MKKNKELTLSDVGFGNKVLINGHVYTYQGQDKRRTSGARTYKKQTPTIEFI